MSPNVDFCIPGYAEGCCGDREPSVVFWESGRLSVTVLISDQSQGCCCDLIKGLIFKGQSRVSISWGAIITNFCTYIDCLFLLQTKKSVTLKRESRKEINHWIMKLCHYCGLRTSSSSFTAGIMSTSFITQMDWAKKRVKEQRGRGRETSWLPLAEVMWRLAGFTFVPQDSVSCYRAWRSEDTGSSRTFQSTPWLFVHILSWVWADEKNPETMYSISIRYWGKIFCFVKD